VAARNPHLDLCRGIAALAVAIGHARAFFFVDFALVSGAGVVAKAFYFLTGLGHQAVVVFFVLSGYFVGGAVAKASAQGRWSWRHYGLNRMSRLWVVLVPALVLTLVWDGLGRTLGGGTGYDGGFTNLIHMGQPAIADIGPIAFLKNLCFLMTIAGPVYGSNAPLWSLAYEFWYYLMFPLAFLALGRGPLGVRLGYFVLFGACVALLPGILVAMGSIWLMGYGAYELGRRPAGALLRHSAFFALALAAFVAVLALVRRGSLAGGDYWLGLSFACAVPFLSQDSQVPRWYRFVAEKLSNLSYTLYLVHFPVLAFCFYLWRLPRLSQPTPLNSLIFAALCALLLGYATLVWWCFERRTDQVKAWAARRLAFAFGS